MAVDRTRLSGLYNQALSGNISKREENELNRLIKQYRKEENLSYSELPNVREIEGGIAAKKSAFQKQVEAQNISASQAPPSITPQQQPAEIITRGQSPFATNRPPGSVPVASAVGGGVLFSDAQGRIVSPITRYEPIASSRFGGQVYGAKSTERLTQVRSMQVPVTQAPPSELINTEVNKPRKIDAPFKQQVGQIFSTVSNIRRETGRTTGEIALNIQKTNKPVKELIYERVVDPFIEYGKSVKELAGYGKDFLKEGTTSFLQYAKGEKTRAQARSEGQKAIIASYESRKEKIENPVLITVPSGVLIGSKFPTLVTTAAATFSITEAIKNPNVKTVSGAILDTTIGGKFLTDKIKTSNIVSDLGKVRFNKRAAVFSPSGQRISPKSNVQKSKEARNLVPNPISYNKGVQTIRDGLNTKTTIQYLRDQQSITARISTIKTSPKLGDARVITTKTQEVFRPLDKAGKRLLANPTTTIKDVNAYMSKNIATTYRPMETMVEVRGKGFAQSPKQLPASQRQSDQYFGIMNRNTNTAYFKNLQNAQQLFFKKETITKIKPYTYNPPKVDLREVPIITKVLPQQKPQVVDLSSGFTQQRLNPRQRVVDRYLARIQAKQETRLKNQGIVPFQKTEVVVPFQRSGIRNVPAESLNPFAKNLPLARNVPGSIIGSTKQRAGLLANTKSSIIDAEFTSYLRPRTNLLTGVRYISALKGSIGLKRESLLDTKIISDTDLALSNRLSNNIKIINDVKILSQSKTTTASKQILSTNSLFKTKFASKVPRSIPGIPTFGSAPYSPPKDVFEPIKQSPILKEEKIIRSIITMPKPQRVKYNARNVSLFNRQSNRIIPKINKIENIKIKTKYIPTVFSTAFNIRGKESRLATASGLGVRPL